MDLCEIRNCLSPILSLFFVLKVKSDGQNTRTWCKRRGVEEQRLYDITKLRRQFQDILRV
jgi:hypothetical protein